MYSNLKTSLQISILVMALAAGLVAQSGTNAPGGRSGGPPAPRLTVTSTAWPDGGEIPLRHAGRFENRSPAFEFRWLAGTEPAAPPSQLRSYAVIFHDMSNFQNNGTNDSLHWMAFNIPGSAKGLPEGLGPGDLPDGTRNGMNTAGRVPRDGKTFQYFGPGAGPGPFHHYAFEFYALDTTLDLPANATREEVLQALQGHVIGKAAFFGRFRGPAPQ